MTEESTPKKGRGRPKKNIVAVEVQEEVKKKIPQKTKPVVEESENDGTEEEAVEDEEVGEEEEVTPPPSPRTSRTPKSSGKKRPAPNVDADVAEDAPPKRGRGRPPKNAKAAAARRKGTVYVKTGKPRGRPKKVH